MSNRYRNTDYALLSVLRYLNKDGFKWIDIIYNIACEYHKNWLSRIKSYDSALLAPDADSEFWRWFIPKFHIIAHGPKCQCKFSLNWIRGCGRTFGEMVEQEWAHIKKCAAATREQGSGARHLTLDHQWSGWNWRRLLGLGNRMRQLPVWEESLIYL
jgi:hypothetical protein